jgi:hypothetical protein
VQAARIKAGIKARIKAPIKRMAVPFFLASGNTG